MTIRAARLTIPFILAAFVGLLGACGISPDIRQVSKPSESKRQYLGMKKIAVLPFTNIGGNKGAEEQAMPIVISELSILGTFETVEDPHYVGSVLKALKLRKIEDLDLETVQKMGSETGAQVILFGDVNAWGLGEGDFPSMQVSITMTLMDTQTGKPVWLGNGYGRGSFTWSRSFGLNEGPTDLEIARIVVIDLLTKMDKEITARREAELERIKSEESAKLQAAAEAEKRRLEEMLQEDDKTESK